jgi:flagellar hook-associated protein 1 FlgK
MVNIMHSLYNSVDAMRINQAGLSVVSNNIANMNTEGYSKQRLDLASVTYQSATLGQTDSIMVGGVTIEKVTRYQDEFLNSFLIGEKSSYGYDKQLYSNISTLESYFNEVDGSGLTGAFQSYFAAAKTLADTPTDKVIRANFVTQAQSVAQQFNAKATNLENFRTNLVGDGLTQSSLDNSEIGKRIDDINNKLNQIAELNKQISVFSQGSEPNSLLDQRQLLIEELSESIPITTRYEGTSCDVYMGNIQLINSGQQSITFKASPSGDLNPVTVSLVSTKDPSVVYVPNYLEQEGFSPTQGSLKAMLDMGGNGPGSIYEAMTELDNLAREFAVSVNEIQLRADAGPPTQASLKMNPTTGQLEIATQNIFLNSSNAAAYDPTLISAANLCVNQAVINDPFEVATAYAEVAGATVVSPNAVGNNNNASMFLGMRDTKMAGLQGQTPEGNLYSIASKIGNSSALAKSQLTAQEKSVQQLSDQKQSIVGVSLDEELVDLMKFQKAYQASAQVFSVVSQMMDVIMSMAK